MGMFSPHIVPLPTSCVPPPPRSYAQNDVGLHMPFHDTTEQLGGEGSVVKYLGFIREKP